MSSNRYPVALNVPPTFDCIELVQVNEATRELEKATSAPCAFNRAKRQIETPEAVAETIKELYNANGIPMNTPAILILPSIFSKEFDAHGLSKEEVRFALVSEAERFYVFKDKEPQIGWVNLDETHLLYTAYPKAELEKYVQVFQDLKIPLHSIDLNYYSVLRGLLATGAIGESEIEGGHPWAMTVVTDTAFFAAVLQGVQIIRTVDVPFSPGGDDDYFEVQQDFEGLIGDDPMSKLVIVNNAINLNFDAFVGSVRFGGEKIPIDQQVDNLRSRGSVQSNAYPCTLEAIGGVFVREFGNLPSVNLKPRAEGDVGDIGYLQEHLFRALVGLNVALFVFMLIVWGLFSLLIKFKENQARDLAMRAAQMSSSADVEEYKNLQLKLFIKKSVDQNVMANDLLVKLGTLTDTDDWLDKIAVKAGSDAGSDEVSIDGESLKPERVNNIVNDLKRSTNRRDLQIAKVDTATTPDGTTNYVWSIVTGSGNGNGNGGGSDTGPHGGPQHGPMSPGGPH